MDNFSNDDTRPSEANSQFSPASPPDLDAGWGSAIARLFDMDAAGVSEIDLGRRRFIRVNRQYCLMMRRDERELLDMEIGDVLTPEGQVEVVTEIEGWRREAWPLAGRIAACVGRRRARLDACDPLVHRWGADGAPLRAVSVVQDISERVEATEKLKRSEQFMTLGQQVGHIATFVRDLRTGAVACSANYRKIMGLPEGDQELPVEVWSRVMDREDRKRVAGIMSAAVARRDTDVAYEFRVQRPGEAEIRHFEMRARYLYDGQGRPLTSFGVAIDVTERVHSAEKLRISEELLSIGQQAGQIATYVRDLRAGTVACNAYGRRLLGLPETEEDVPYAVWSKYILREDMESATALSVAAFARQASEIAFDLRVQRPNETELRHFEMRARLVYDEAGKPLRAIGVAIDVTERVRSAEKRRLNEELRRLAHEAGRIGMFARDLNRDFYETTPELRAILGIPDEVKQVSVTYCKTAFRRKIGRGSRR